MSVTSGTVSAVTTNGNTTAGDEIVHCVLFQGDQHKCDVIIALKRTTASISLIGCVFMMFVIFLFRKYTIFAQRLILYLTIAAFFRSIAYIMGDDYKPGALCNFQAWMVTSFDWMVLLWVCCITFNLFMSVIRMTYTEKFEWVYHLVSWGLPFFLSFLPFTGNHYGPAGVWCWIEKDHGWRMGLWYGPLFISIAVLVVVYIYIVVTVRRKQKNWEGLHSTDIKRRQKILADEVTPLTAYPFVYLALSVFPLINRIQNTVSSEAVFGLYVMHVLTTPLQGAVNAVVFGLDKETASKLTPKNIWLEIQSRREEHKTVIMEYPLETVQSGGPNQATGLTTVCDTISTEQPAAIETEQITKQQSPYT